MNHIGNNWYVIRTSQGENRTDIGNVTNAVCLSPDDGTISIYDGGWKTLSFNTKQDVLAASITISRTLTNIGTTYNYVYPAFYDNVPLAVDLAGFTKLGIVVFWNKNGGTGRHDIVLVDKSEPQRTLLTSTGLPNGLVNGVNKSYDYPIPIEFNNYRGEVYLGAKSTVGTDSPILDAVFLYLIR